MSNERALSGKDLVLYRGKNNANTIGAVSVGSGGTGYTSAPTVAFSGGGGTGAAGTAVVSGGVVTAINITNAGSGYTSTPTVALTGGAGSGAAATATRLTAETFDLLPCLTSNDINQTSSPISTVTKCGVIKLPGTKEVVVPFSFVPKLSPDAGKVAMETLQDDYKNDVESNWKATTQSPKTGDPIFTFRGFLSELSWKAGTSEFNGSSSIQVDEDGVTLEFVP